MKGIRHFVFFLSECEVAFCGHATIAVMYNLIKLIPERARNPVARIRIYGERDSRAK